ncbi:hypothetical protein KSC_006150 [Ktedonobacter sp. SOSP1-52]|nr:hypothetical protein KSC_006150 [Ktedonobacter sp. SOSP1-52]
MDPGVCCSSPSAAREVSLSATWSFSFPHTLIVETKADRKDAVWYFVPPLERKRA